jgi:hypothetical protein
LQEALGFVKLVFTINYGISRRVPFNIRKPILGKGDVWGHESEKRPTPTRNTRGACEFACANTYAY